MGIRLYFESSAEKNWIFRLYEMWHICYYDEIQFEVLMAEEKASFFNNQITN